MAKNHIHRTHDMQAGETRNSSAFAAGWKSTARPTSPIRCLPVLRLREPNRYAVLESFRDAAPNTCT